MRWLFISSLAFLGACVSSGKYDSMEDQYKTTYLRYKREQMKNRHLTSQMKSSSQEMGNLKDRNANNRERLALLERNLHHAQRYARQNQYYAEKIRAALAIEGLDVRLEDDRLLIKLPGDVLFASGSASLSSSGQGHIRELGRILISMSDRKVQIEGHTDNVPINTTQYPSNWYLGYDRAMSVLKVMTAQGFSENLISAASYGENMPIAENTTSHGKQQNRRIEVLVIPNLDHLQEVVGNDSSPPAPSYYDIPSF